MLTCVMIISEWSTRLLAPGVMCVLFMEGGLCAI